MSCICDNPGYCPLLRTTMFAEQHHSCRNDPEFHKAMLKKHGVRMTVRRGDEPPPVVNSRDGYSLSQKSFVSAGCVPCTEAAEKAMVDSKAAAKSAKKAAKIAAKQPQPPGSRVGLQPVNPLETGPVVTNRQGRPALGLRDQFHGQSVFLCGGGPSLKEVDLSQLNQRGIIVAAMNNAATVVRPNLWFCVDLPRNFHEVIWRDPAVMKFTFDKHLKASRPVDSWNGTEYIKCGIRSEETPNTWGFAHCHGWDSAQFLTHPVPTWGCNSAAEDPEGKDRHESVMLPAIWLLYWLGFRTIYLLGCDFHMTDERAYAFDEKGNLANNVLYRWLDNRFLEMRDHFMDRGLTVLNCTEGSHLTAFERLPLDSAIKATLENWPDEIVTRGHYRGP